MEKDRATTEVIYRLPWKKSKKGYIRVLKGRLIKEDWIVVIQVNNGKHWWANPKDLIPE